jgi:hypothetical protein
MGFSLPLVNQRLTVYPPAHMWTMLARPNVGAACGRFPGISEIMPLVPDKGTKCVCCVREVNFTTRTLAQPAIQYWFALVRAACEPQAGVTYLTVNDQQDRPVVGRLLPAELLSL